MALDSGDEDYFNVNIRDKAVKFPDNDYRIYLSKADKKFSRKVDEEKKRNMI